MVLRQKYAKDEQEGKHSKSQRAQCEGRMNHDLLLKYIYRSKHIRKNVREYSELASASRYEGVWGMEEYFSTTWTWLVSFNG
jgi:hypothetical protein